MIVDDFVKENEDMLKKQNNYLLKAKRCLDDKGVSFVLPIIKDVEGNIFLDATKLKQVKNDVFSKTVRLQLFTDKNGKQIIMREL